MAVLIAFFLSIALYTGVTTYTNLATDIRGATGIDQAVITDMVVSIDDGSLVVSTGKDIPALESVSMLFVYDTETVRRTDSTVVSEYDAAIAEGNSGEATVVLSLGSVPLLKDSELLRLRVTGSVYDIVVSDIVATFSDGSSEPLSITLP